jgi:hypothetical protein
MNSTSSLTESKSSVKPPITDRPFNPIDIFRIDAETLIEKLGKNAYKSKISSYISNKMLKGTLYFYFSNHYFPHDSDIDVDEDKLIDKSFLFRRERKESFRNYLRENYPHTTPFNCLYNHYRSGRFCAIVIQNTFAGVNGPIELLMHDSGYQQDLFYKYIQLLEVFVRLLGEQVDHGYDPLCELVAMGLIIESVPLGLKGTWTDFLTKDLYDPRLLILISQFEN